MIDEKFKSCIQSERFVYWCLFLTQPIRYPSKNFSIFITCMLIMLSAFLSAGISPVFPMIIPFLKEWWRIGYSDLFPAYLLMVSYLILMVSVLAQIKGAAFDMACYLKRKHGMRIVP